MAIASNPSHRQASGDSRLGRAPTESSCLVTLHLLLLWKLYFQSDLDAFAFPLWTSVAVWGAGADYSSPTTWFRMVAPSGESFWNIMRFGFHQVDSKQTGIGIGIELTRFKSAASRPHLTRFQGIEKSGMLYFISIHLISLIIDLSPSVVFAHYANIRLCKETSRHNLDRYDFLPSMMVFYHSLSPPPPNSTLGFRQWVRNINWTIKGKN